MTIGMKLRILRGQHGLTLIQLGAAIDLSLSYLSDMERNRTMPTLDTVARIADHYQMTLSAVLESVTINGLPRVTHEITQPPESEARP